MEYKQTINLPKTSFGMKANLPQREPERLKKWDEMKIYEAILENRKGAPKYILHDGPPYANGNIHLGHALNKILKDFVVKYKAMSGFYAPYVPGWDCHGLPIEHEVSKKLGKEKLAQMEKIHVRQECRRYANKFIDKQRKSFIRLGVFGDWFNPYVTMSNIYEARIVQAFAEFVRKGLVYKGLRPVHWCPHCRTALADAEVEYQKHTSPSVFVKFPVVNQDYSMLIWTTTPWTLPANVAVCLHPDFNYRFVKVGDEKYLLSEDRIEGAMEELGITDYEIVGESVRGAEFEHLVCEHPFKYRHSKVILGTHVTNEAGTGCVHTAPGHGAEDFHIGQHYGLPVVNPVDDAGCFMVEVAEFQGQYVQDANRGIVDKLVREGVIIHHTSFEHSYPHCWRCHTPVIFRATEQWFIRVSEKAFLNTVLEEIKATEWVPKWGEERIRLMVQDRPDWCVSRQRSWGVPIPVVNCQQCGEAHLDVRVIDKFAELSLEEGNDCWFSHPVEDFLPEGFACACGSTDFSAGQDILDVWFDSGVSHYAVLETREDHHWPADMYLEGQDQYRGWFQTSLLAAVGLRNSAPYKTVLTHGFTVDEFGRAMSKSKENGVDPQDIIKQYGADILRMWVASTDYRTEMVFSEGILKQNIDVYRRIRNTARFLLGNLSDFDPQQHWVDYADLTEIDQWALARLQWLIARIDKAYETYEFHRVYHTLHNYCANDLGGFYLDVMKDRLYCDGTDWQTRRGTQTVLYEIVTVLARLMAPILVFTAEEIWENIPNRDDSSASVHLTRLPEPNDEMYDNALLDRWSEVMKIRSEVLKPLEKLRQEKTIGSSLEANVTLYIGSERLRNLLADLDLNQLLIVSHAAVEPFDAQDGIWLSEEINDFGVQITKATGEKCERCWNYRDSVGQSEAHPTLCDRCEKAVS